jgi:hypothetical protein
MSAVVRKRTFGAGPSGSITEPTKAQSAKVIAGGPGRTRTSGLRFRKPLLYPEELLEIRSSELISNSTSADASKNTSFKGHLETVLPSESTELQRKLRSRERILELATFQGAEVFLRMLQIPRVFSRQNPD